MQISKLLKNSHIKGLFYIRRFFFRNAWGSAWIIFKLKSYVNKFTNFSVSHALGLFDKLILPILTGKFS